jgi:hypothetical protein
VRRSGLPVNIAERALRSGWRRSPAFIAYRGSPYVVATPALNRPTPPRHFQSIAHAVPQGGIGAGGPMLQDLQRVSDRQATGEPVHRRKGQLWHWLIQLPIASEFRRVRENRLGAGIDHTLLEALIVERASFNDAHGQYRLFQESEVA